MIAGAWQRRHRASAKLGVRAAPTFLCDRCHIGGWTAARRWVLMSTDLLDRAPQAGDGEAFRQSPSPIAASCNCTATGCSAHSRTPRTRCRTRCSPPGVGSPRFEGRSSLRTWLYQVATSRCLNILRRPTGGRRGEPAAARRCNAGAEPHRRGDLARPVSRRPRAWARRAARTRRPLRGERGDLDRVPHGAPGAPARVSEPCSSCATSSVPRREVATILDATRGVRHERPQAGAGHRPATAVPRW